MAKKNFTGGLSSLLGDEPQPQAEAPAKKTGRPQTSQREITKSSQEGTKENETRATFIINEGLLDKIKAVAYWERSLIKDVLAEALEATLSSMSKSMEKSKTYQKRGSLICLF